MSTKRFGAKIVVAKRFALVKNIRNIDYIIIKNKIF